MRRSLSAESGAPSTRKPNEFQPTMQFWMILAAIGIISLCNAVEGTIIVNALPTIVQDLGAGSLYTWITNAFFLAFTAALPLYAQICDIFGRRNTMLWAVAIFIVGSFLCGASSSLPMLVAARALQGLGGGGIEIIGETITLDLVPLRERSKYMSFVQAGIAVGYSSGPVLGGIIVDKLNWRWTFYLAGLLGAIAQIMLFLFLRVNRRRDQTLQTGIRRIDIGGNIIFIAATTTIILGLTWGGVVYRWDSAQVLLPLIFGVTAMGAFVAFERTPKLAPEPSFPLAIISNRTSIIALCMAFIVSFIQFTIFYFLPVYFQAVLGKTPIQSGISLTPLTAAVVPSQPIIGIALSKFGQYKPLHMIGWIMLAIAVGLFITLDQKSTTITWVAAEVLFGIGFGNLAITTLPALQAPLEEKYTAAATGIFFAIKGFGNIWGVTIPAVLFSNILSDRVESQPTLHAQCPTFADEIAHGKAYQLTTQATVGNTSNADCQIHLAIAFAQGLRAVFILTIGLLGIGLFLTLFEKEVPMRTESNTEFGLSERDPSGK